MNEVEILTLNDWLFLGTVNDKDLFIKNSLIHWPAIQYCTFHNGKVQ